MKTIDLIPLILLELKDDDKYGLELTKNIEDKTNSAIIIKQPTLYTILKKLEKSKFITSYWQDSEIGGKRHYYKLTANGKLQTSTLPTFDELVKIALNSDGGENKEGIEEIENKTIPSNINLKVDALPSNEVFKDDNIDNLTSVEINQNNVELLKENTIKVKSSIENNIENAYDFSSNVFDMPEKVIINNSDIEYKDYVDFTTSKSNINARKLANGFCIKSIINALYLFLVVGLSIFLNIKYFSFNWFSYVVLSLGCVCAIALPFIYFPIRMNLRIKFLKHHYIFNIKKWAIISSCCFILGVVATIFVNIGLGINTFKTIFNIKNFANLYCPILLLLDLYLNFVFSCLLLRKNNYFKFA